MFKRVGGHLIIRSLREQAILEGFLAKYRSAFLLITIFCWHGHRLWSCWHTPCGNTMWKPWKVTWFLPKCAGYAFLLNPQLPKCECIFKYSYLFSGLKINEARPHHKLPFRGAWLWVGSEMIHLMELPNPDPVTGRPKHGGRDRHICITVQDISKSKEILNKAGNSLVPLVFFYMNIPENHGFPIS